ncbi:MAG: transposase [Bdellovibrionota bacterium]|nr:transposase [Bdellovibrionota bacterium]
MPRKKLIRTNLYYYHITTRSNHKEWFSLPLDKVWLISKNAINKAMKNNPAIISQFVLMSNHYHLLIKTPNKDIDKFMFWFNKTFSDSLRKESGQVNRMFGSSYKWTLIYEYRYLRNVTKYIYQNPLRANIVDKCEDYPYSTLHYLHHHKNLGFKIESLINYDDQFSVPMTLNEINEVRSGLRKTIYKPNSKRNY